MKEKSWTKFPVLFSLYIAQSIPMSFFSTVIPVIMRQEKYSLESIGLLQLVKLPWIFKFLWAPLIDNNARTDKQLRRVIIFSELFYAIVILSIAVFNLQTDFKLIVILMIVAFIASATQDIAVDIFAILQLKPSERSLGNSMQSAGSFVGSLFGTGVLLIAYYYFGWTNLLVILSAFVVFAIVPLLVYRKPQLNQFENENKQRVSLNDIYRFFSERGKHKRVLILIFYYSGIIGILTMLKPYLVDLGYNVKQIGFMSGIFGTSIGAISAFAGGFIVKKAGRKLSMYIFSILSLFTALWFWFMTKSVPSLTVIYFGIGMLWGTYGLSTVAIYTTSMDIVRKGREGTDFTIQIVITHLSSLIIAVFSGKIGDMIGYNGLFLIEVFLCLLIIGILFIHFQKITQMKISEELLTKYNVPVPRYTSYPPANHFKDSFTGGDYLKMLKESNSLKPEKIAFYIHIPFCQKICYYCGCNACSIGNGNMVAPYMDALMKEIELVSKHIDKNRKVSQIHYGGGTPNSLDVASIAKLNEYFFKHFTFADNPEIAIECNPAYLDYKYIDNLIKAGFNRFSLGIQDFNNDILKQVNRLPSAIPPDELFTYLKATGKNINVNFDFIYGLPGQTIDSFSETIQKAIAIRPDRLVTFSYAHVPWIKKHQLILEKKGLPAPGEKMDMFLAGYRLLRESGYKPIGLDHFVLPSDDLYKAENEGILHRNFQGYCTRLTTGQVYAFGVTAISQLEQGYSQNKKEISEYIADIMQEKLPVERGYVLSDDQIITREVITEIMCNKKICFSRFAETKNISVNDLKNAIKIDDATLIGFEQDGLIRLTSDLIEVTEPGTFFIRNIAASLDREYMEKVQTYSKTV